MGFGVGFSELLDDYFGGGATAKWPPEMGAEAAEVGVEEFEHNGEMGLGQNWVFAREDHGGRGHI